MRMPPFTFRISIFVLPFWYCSSIYIALAISHWRAVLGPTSKDEKTNGLHALENCISHNPLCTDPETFNGDTAVRVTLRINICSETINSKISNIKIIQARALTSIYPQESEHNFWDVGPYFVVCLLTQIWSLLQGIKPNIAWTFWEFFPNGRPPCPLPSFGNFGLILSFFPCSSWLGWAVESFLGMQRPPCPHFGKNSQRVPFFNAVP